MAHDVEGPDDLAEADRRIANAARRVADQLALIERTERSGNDMAVLIRMLGQMRETLRRWRARRDAILLRQVLQKEA
jgi:hypothetical protein